MKLLFATSNINKAKELSLLVPDKYELLTLNDIDLNEEIPENSDTLEGNARQKSSYIIEHFALDCFADDTGLEVAALNGAPGVYSARYAGPEKDDQKNIQKLLTALMDSSNRSAQFKTVMALCFQGQEHLITGICKGYITLEPKGDKGFGYDPIFEPKGFNITFAEMDMESKNKISHRGIAVRKLIDFIQSL